MAQQVELALAALAVAEGRDAPPAPSWLESHRDLSEWHVLEARAARRRGEFERAWQALGAARALVPQGHPHAHRVDAEDGALRLMQEEIDAGRRQLESAVEALWEGPLRADSHLPRLHRAYARLRAGDLEGARADLRVLLAWRTEADLGALWGPEAWAAGPVLEFAARSRVESVFARQLLNRLRPPAVRPVGPSLVLRVEILGPLRVLRGTAALAEEAFERPQVRALLAYLALHHPRPVSPEELVETLWPQAGSVAGTPLYTTVSRLRRAIGREAVKKDGAGYHLSDDVEVDAVEFNRALGAHPPQRGRAVGLWRGEVLADMPTAEWCFLARDTYRARFVDAATRQGEASLAQHDLGSAQAMFERALEADPFSEPAVQGLMRVLVLTGDAPRALRLFHRFTETLERELGVQPSEETFRLAQRLAG